MKKVDHFKTPMCSKKGFGSSAAVTLPALLSHFGKLRLEALKEVTEAIVKTHIPQSADNQDFLSSKHRPFCRVIE